MVEIRVTVTKELDALLDQIVDSGVYQSKAELMRSAAIYLLMNMGLIEEHIKNNPSSPRK